MIQIKTLQDLTRFVKVIVQLSKILQSKHAVSNKKFIQIKGAKMHNLKNVSVKIPRNNLTVITGVSGSGKSTLAFDTLYAEGQRRYVESLSSYARQFMGRMEKPLVDEIIGLTPSIAIEQKVINTNSRSTIATTSDLYEYLKLMYAKFGKTISPISGNEVKAHSVADVIAFLKSKSKSNKVLIVFNARVNENEGLNTYIQKGFSRIYQKQKLAKLEEFTQRAEQETSNIKIVVDRLVLDPDDEHLESRLADSIENAFWEGDGEMSILLLDEIKNHWDCFDFNNRFELDGMSFEKPSLNLLSFNNPYGACKTCEGFGSIIDIDPELVIPNSNLSIAEGAVAPWRGPTMKSYQNEFISEAINNKFPIHKPYRLLTASQKEFLWGKKNRKEVSLYNFFEELTRKSYKIQYRVLLSKYRGKTTCHSCLGTKLRKDAQYIFLQPVNKRASHLVDILNMTVSEANRYFQNIQLPEEIRTASKVLVDEIQTRLHLMDTIGLGYLQLSRASNTLSGGESQRIKIAYSLGSNLTGSTYVLDEPSIGLHSQDSEKLISVLKNLKNLNNTVLVVEHDEDIMRQADYLIDIGPEAGTNGGQIVYQGSFEQMLNSNSLTANYLNKQKRIKIPEQRRKWNNKIVCKNARLNNLKDINISFPLNTLTVVVGVSGSGKSTLVKKTLVPLLQRAVNEKSNLSLAKIGSISGDIQRIDEVEIVDQNPIGRSSRSNPVTYVKAYDAIRELFSLQSASKHLGLKAKDFSFNVDGGRCERCKGEGEEIVEMQFIANIHLTCEDCKGKRFKKKVLDIQFKKKSIHDVLQLTVDEAMVFFAEQNSIIKKLKPLQDVGLGYVALGQSSNTLSGGEAQRVKLASYLAKTNNKEHRLFVFDEPTTGLHFHDIKKLLKAFNQLIEEGNTIVVVEHNLDVIKSADWLIEIGPKAGMDGGEIVFEGTPENLIKKKTKTSKYLKMKI